MKLAKKLSPAVVEEHRPEENPYRVWDTVVPQLHLRIQPSGVKSWNVQWRRTSTRSLGKWPGVTVESARQKARAALAEADVHGAPLAVVEARKAASDRPTSLGAFVADHYAPWAAANQKAGAANVSVLGSVFADLYGLDLRKVSPPDIEAVKARRLKAGRKPATVNRDLDRIRSVLTRAVEWGFLTDHPMRSVKKLKGVDNSRVRYLDADEEGRLRAALAAREQRRRDDRKSGNAHQTTRGKKPRRMWAKGEFTDYLVPMVLLALNTGLRRGELFGIRWRDVNLHAKRLTVPLGIAKSQKGRHLPLNTEAVDALKRWRPRAAPDDALVFPSAEGGRLNNIAKSWAGIIEAADLEGFRFHDMRHSFASRLVMAGVDLNTVRELLGHADIQMTLRYAHLAPARLAEAVAKLGAAR